LAGLPEKSHVAIAVLLTVVKRVNVTMKKKTSGIEITCFQVFERVRLYRNLSKNRPFCGTPDRLCNPHDGYRDMGIYRTGLFVRAFATSSK
jgi:hypothetical protein